MRKLQISLRLTVFILFFLFCFIRISDAAQSTIADVEGNACMGDDKSRKQTEQAAFTDAKRNAAERAVTYLKSETQVKDLAVEKDLIDAYSRASVTVIHELERVWYKDAAAGDCCRIRIKAEVVPVEKAMQKAAHAKDFADDPAAPLKVKLWTDKSEYKQGEKVKIYLKGNKPFYARVLYRDAKGEMVQLLPNPYRRDAYFNGGTVYQIPSGNDRFDLEVSPPFGEENIVVYGSTAELGSIETRAEGSVYRVTTRVQDMGVKTRGITITDKQGKASTAEFCEETQSIRTSR
jgi:cell division protein FtsB